MTTKTLIHACPSPESYAALRKACGWGDIDIETASTALAGSVRCVSLYDGEQLIGFGRIVGDYALNYYLQDIMVSDAARGHGHGAMIVGALLD